MDLTLITDTNLKAFEDLIFMENHLLGLPVISVGVVDDGRPIAAGSMDVDGTTGRIISVYTEESYQNKGAASMLLDGFRELAASLKLMTTRILWHRKKAQTGFLPPRATGSLTELRLITSSLMMPLIHHRLKAISKKQPGMYI